MMAHPAFVCPICRAPLTHVCGAYFRCEGCALDYGVFSKRRPYTGYHRVRLRTASQIRQAKHTPLRR